MKRVTFLLSVSWRPILWWLSISAVFLVLLLFKLGTLVPGAAQEELDVLSHLNNRDLGIMAIFQDPAHLPYYLQVYIFEKLHLSGVFYGRLIGVTMGVAAIFSFYYLLSRWHTPRIAFLTTIMFSTSSWFLHSVRIAAPDASYLLILPLLACGAWLHDTKTRISLPLLVGSALTGALLYIPGLIWFSVVGLFWQRKHIRYGIGRLSQWELFFGVIGLIVSFIPFSIAAFNDPAVIVKLLGLPASIPSLQEVGTQLFQITRQIFFSGINNPVYWVGNMPLLDALTITAFVLGCISFYTKLSLDRTRILIFGVVLGAVLYSLGIAPLVLLLPFVYLVAANGISYLLLEWYGVFPRNPIARTLGTVLLTVAIATSVFYNLSHYFVAWANAPETKRTFSRNL